MTPIPDLVPSQAGLGCALVTGGTGAVGSAVIRALARQGYPVAFTYLTATAAAERLVDELEQLGVEAHAWRVDLSQSAAVAAAVADVGERFGSIRLLVNAAGPPIPMTYLSEVEPEMYSAQLDAEAKAFFNVAHATIPHLRRTRGAIVAVTTAATNRYAIRDGLSACTKAAVDQLVQGFAVEEGKFGIRVNAVGPGMLTDGIGGRLMASGDLDEDVVADVTRRTPLRSFASAADVADAVLFLAGDQARMLTGQKLNVDGGWSI